MKHFFLYLAILISMNSFAQNFKMELLNETELNSKENYYIRYANFDNQGNIILGFLETENYPICGFKVISSEDFSVLQLNTIEGVMVDNLYSSKIGNFIFATNDMFGGGEFVYKKENEKYVYNKTLYLSNPTGYYHIKLRDVTFSENEEYLAIGGWVSPGGALKVYKTSDLETNVFYEENPTNSLAFSPDGKYLIAGSPIGIYTVYSVNNKIEKKTEHIDCGCFISELTFSPNSKYLANILTNDENKRMVSIHSFENEKLSLKNLNSMDAIDYNASIIGFTKGGKYLILKSETAIYIYSVENNFKLIKTINMKMTIYNVAINIQRDKLLVTDHNTLKIYKIN